jgi:acetolactate synthase-1/2/3 large subunit
VFGQGILLSGAKKELKQFIEKSGIPAGATLLGLSALESDHPLHMGMLGMHGNYAPNVKTNDCDVLIAVGMRFDDRVTGNVKTYAKDAKVIHIEIDDAEIDKNIKTDVAIHADAKEALSKLLPIIKTKTYPEWVAEFEVCKKIETEKIIRSDVHPESGKIRMGEVVNLVSEITDDNAVIVTDVGQHQMITERYYRYRTTNSNVTSGGLGTMGFALPASIGAKIGQPERQVVAVIGDGGFQMTLQELVTIFQYKIPVKIIILNNNFLGMVRQWQQLFFTRRYSFTELVNPEFSKVAESFGITSQKITDRKDRKPALDEMMDHKGPYLLDIIVEKEENVFPMVPSGACISEIRLE